MFTPDTLKSYAAEIIIEEQINFQNDQFPHNLYNDLKNINDIKNIREKEKYTKKKLEVLERHLHYLNCRCREYYNNILDHQGDEQYCSNLIEGMKLYVDWYWKLLSWRDETNYELENTVTEKKFLYSKLSEEYKNMCTRFVFNLSDFELSFDDEDVFLYLFL